MKLSTIRGRTRQVLRDEFVSGEDLEFKDDELDIYIQDCLQEISAKSPYKSVEPIILAANSTLLGISGITDLIKVRQVEYPVGEKPSSPRNYRNFDYLDSETIEVRVDSAPTKVGSAGVITGILTFAAASATVTGTGGSIDFTGELAAGYFIKPSSGKKWYRVLSVESVSSLTLEETVKARDACVDGENASQYRERVALVYCEKAHELTENSSTLGSQHERLLVQGVSGRAAVAKSRKLIDSINVGGTGTPSAMQAWGLNQLALFKEGLDKIPSAPRVSREYPTG